MSNETTGTTPQARDLILDFGQRLENKMWPVRVIEAGETDPGESEDEDTEQ